MTPTEIAVAYLRANEAILAYTPLAGAWMQFLVLPYTDRPLRIFSSTDRLLSRLDAIEYAALARMRWLAERALLEGLDEAGEPIEAESSTFTKDFGSGELAEARCRGKE